MQADEEAIRVLIQRQFESLSWTPETEAGWSEFAADFLTGAPLYGAARPPQPQTVADFVTRMKQLSKTSLRSLDERLLGCKIEVFGDIAVAISVCELTENNEENSRNVEAMLLTKDSDQWRIAAQAWDTETDAKQIPAEFPHKDK